MSRKIPHVKRKTAITPMTVSMSESGLFGVCARGMRGAVKEIFL
jgi:hypothetical protein